MERQKLIQLLQKMTLEEKCRELMQIPVEAYVESDISTGPCEELHLTPEKMAQVGSVLSLAGAKETKRVQEKHLEKNRLGIPLLFMADVINGYRTIFPIPLAQGCTFHASVSVKNIGTYEGQETVQMYIQDVTASVARPIRELKGFQKIFLKPEEEQQVCFEICEEMLRFWDIDMNYVSESGRFRVWIGTDSRTENGAEFWME